MADALLRSALAGIDELWEEEEETIQARARKRSAASAANKQGESPEPTGSSSVSGVLAACSACRQAKVRCLAAARPGDSDAGPCPRCVAIGKPCVFPARRTRGPKRRLTKRQRTLDGIRRDIRSALASLTGALSPLEDDSIHSEGQSESEQDIGDTLNPLAVLSRVADERTEAMVDRRGSTSQDYYAGGLYQARPEMDFSGDPIALGILTERDFERLVQLYFASMRPFLWLLLPQLHTPEYLRSTSPFLTTALAFAAATYDPLSAHFVARLDAHARSLATRIYYEGLKSLEIVQAYFFLSHWTPSEVNYADDRSWTWLGQAWRIATELRIDRSLDQQDVLAATNRSLTWALLFCGDLAMTVQTGRIECFRGFYVSRMLSVPATPPPADHPEYDYLANLHVNLIFARALDLLAGLREQPSGEGLRQTFMASWKPEIEAWRRQWPHVNPFVDVHAENNYIVLNLMSRRFKGGPAVALIADCKAAALRTIQRVSSWEDNVIPLAYCSNYVIFNIAYCPLLLLHLSEHFGLDSTDDLRTPCLRIANVLDRISRDRPNARSIAAVHASRIRALVEQPGEAPAVPQLNAEPAQEPVDFEALFPLPAAEFLDMTMQDPMLGWLWGDGT